MQGHVFTGQSMFNFTDCPKHGNTVRRNFTRLQRLKRCFGIVHFDDLGRVLRITKHDVRAIQRSFHRHCGTNANQWADMIVTFQRQVVQTQHNILTWYDDRLTVCRRHNIVCRHHQYARLQLRFQRQGHMNRHLVAIKICVERCAN